jgi:hypothetical protein
MRRESPRGLEFTLSSHRNTPDPPIKHIRTRTRTRTRTRASTHAHTHLEVKHGIVHVVDEKLQHGHVSRCFRLGPTRKQPPDGRAHPRHLFTRSLTQQVENADRLGSGVRECVGCVCVCVCVCVLVREREGERECVCVCVRGKSQFDLSERRMAQHAVGGGQRLTVSMGTAGSRAWQGERESIFI